MCLPRFLLELAPSPRSQEKASGLHSLAVEAARRGVSKAALIREFVRERLVDGRTRTRDPLDDLLGSSDAEPGDIDEVVYGA